MNCDNKFMKNIAKTSIIRWKTREHQSHRCREHQRITRATLWDYVSRAAFKRPNGFHAKKKKFSEERILCIIHTSVYAENETDLHLNVPRRM